MIRDKNIFECIFLAEHIYFPDYVFYGPPSYGMQRRKNIFKIAFPNIESSILTKKSWVEIKKKHFDKRKTFKWSPEAKTLTEVEIYTNAFGDPIMPGDKFEIDNKVIEVNMFEVVKWVGLVAKYDNKKINVSRYKKDLKDNIWKSEEK